MKRSTIYIFVAISLLSLGLAAVPTVFSQTQNVKIVSYSYYIDMAGYLDVVGEVQNTGTNTVTSVILTGQVLSSDGTDQADSYTQIGIENNPVIYLTPGQEAPFYMGFYQPSNPQGASWFSIDISKINLAVAQVNVTASYSYSNFTITSNTHTIGTQKIGTNSDFGVYWVNCNVKNIGTQTAQNITVFGTFYNSTGTVIAVGYSNQVATIDPSQTASFKLGAFDQNQTIVPSSEKIDHYILLVNALTPILQGTPPTITPAPTDGSSSNPTNQPTDTFTTSTPQNPSNNSPNSFNPNIFAIIAAIAIIVVIGAIVVLRKRKPQETDTANSKKAKPYKKAPPKRNR